MSESSSRSQALVCSSCDRTFNKPEHLRRHVLTHTAVKPHHCTVCSRRFARPDALARHLRLHSTDPELPVSTELATSDGSVHSMPEDDPQSQSVLSESSHDESAGREAIDHTAYVEVPAMSTSIDDFSFWQPVAWDVPMEIQNLAFSTDANVEFGMASFEHMVTEADSSGSGPSPASTNRPQTSVGTSESSRMLPRWSGMSSWWTNAIEDDQGYTIPPSVVPDFLRQALEETIVLAGFIPDAAAFASQFSNRWLNTTFRLFWAKTMPIVPVPHAPTLHMERVWAPLLISMATLGSLHAEGDASKHKGIMLWRLVRQVVKGDWKGLVERKDHLQHCRGSPLLVTMLFSQLFALVSKDDNLISDCVIFQPIPLRLAKAEGMIEECTKFDNFPSTMSPSKDLQSSWEEWVSRETLRRTLVSLHLLDSTIVSMSGALPVARHTLNPLRPPSSDLLYKATSAADWQRLRIASPPVVGPSIGSLFSPFLRGDVMPHPINRFARGSLLEGIYSMMMDEVEGVRLGAEYSELIKWSIALDRYYTEFLGNDSEEIVLLIRWHSVCTTLAMARARVESSRMVFHQPFGTSSGRRALLHANAVRQIMKSCSPTSVQAIILPVCLYDCAVVMLDYLRQLQNHGSTASRLRLEQATDWNSIGLLGFTMTDTPPNSNHSQFLWDLSHPWIPTISDVPFAPSDIEPFLAVLGMMSRVWTRCQTYGDELQAQMEKLEG